MNQESIILVLCSLGIAQGIFLCMYLLTLKKGNPIAHRLLVLVILGLMIRIGKSILYVYLDLLPWQRNIGIAGILLVGPSLWLYGKVLLERSTGFAKGYYIHYLPYVLFTLLSFWIPNRADTISSIVYYAVFGHLLLYLIAASMQLVQKSQVVQAKLYTWYRNLILGVGLIWLFYIGNISGLIPFYIGGAIFFTFLVYMFSFLLLRSHTFSLEKYHGSSLDQEASEQLMLSLTALFREKESYLNSKLSLNEVAKKLDTSARMLSQAVNETKGMNFSEYVNQHRIEKAKKLLSTHEGQQEKIASIAYDSGFGNVTSFNLAFKSFTGMTPSEFKGKTAKS